VGIAKVTIVKKFSVKIRRYGHEVVWLHAATPLHVHNVLFLLNILTTVTLAMPKYELPDDGHRPKHVGAFYYEF